VDFGLPCHDPNGRTDRPAAGPLWAAEFYAVLPIATVGNEA